MEKFAYFTFSNHCFNNRVIQLTDCSAVFLTCIHQSVEACSNSVAHNLSSQAVLSHSVQKG
jgi:hypothetical protein